MAFANLFTRLSAVDEDVKSPGHPTLTHRNEGDNGKRGRKRKAHGEQTGPDNKKQRSQTQMSGASTTTPLKDDNSQAPHYHMQNTDSEHARAGFTKKVIRKHSDKAGHNNMYHKARNNHKVNKQQQQKNRTEGPKNQHQQKERGRHTDRGGRHQYRPTSRKGGGVGKQIAGKQGALMKPSRFMTQEFKDQNALLVDGRLLCRHFLWGRCIKGDDCQLEHIQGYNDLIKEVCKFYVQGLCTKGESCPYMHKSFPCKFFHRKGKCSQGADCKFSHEPLNEITQRLLDEALKRENDLYELARKAEQESPAQPASTDESGTQEANVTADTLIRPLRPNFYNSGETNGEQGASVCQTGGTAVSIISDISSQASDSAQPHSPLSTGLNHEEPVCYSVEAVLGPQLFKPFPSFFTNPGSQESAPLTPLSTSGCADQSQVPFSVDTVRACKSVGNSTFGHIPGPPTAQPVSYTPKTDREGLTDHLPSSETEKLPDLVVASGDHKKQCGERPGSLKPAQRPSQEVKVELLHSTATVAEKSVSSERKGDLKGSTHLPVDITYSVNCKSEGVFPFAHTRRRSPTFTPTQPAQLKRPRLLGQTSSPQASAKPLRPPSGVAELKCRAAEPAEAVTDSAETSDSGNSVNHHFAAAQPSEVHQHSKKTQSGLRPGTQQHYSAATTAECSSSKTHKRLFASPVTDHAKSTPDGVTAPGSPQGFIQSSRPTLQSTHCRGEDVHIKTAAEPNKASARSFLSLFAAPLIAAALPCTQPQPDYSRTASCSQESKQSADNTSHLSVSNQRTSQLETQDFRQMSHRPAPPNLNQPACGAGADTSTAQADQQLPDSSSAKGSTVTATANSVLKTLFLCLSPYKHDGEQQDESEKEDKSSTGCVSVKQQQKSKKKRRRKKKLKPTEKVVAPPTEGRPSVQTSRMCLQATAGSNLSSPATAEPHVRNSGTRNLPFKPMMQLMQHHTRPSLRHTSGEAKCVSGNVAVTPLKDLFKTLDTTGFHFGH